MDRISAMNAFVRVVEAGNFSRAADTLDIPNATLTRLIQRLEQHLKVRLLHRTTHAVTVTPEGAAYYERVVRLLAELADIESSASLSHTRPSGRVRVEAAAALGTTVIVPGLPELYREYPEIQVDLGIGNRQADLIAEGIDCAVRVGGVTEQFLVARHIGEFRFVTCATPRFIAEHGRPDSPADLANRPTVGMTSTATGRPFPFRFHGSDGDVLEVSPSHSLVVNDTNAYLAAALAGLGYVQAPAYAVEAHMESGELVAVLEDWQTPAVPVHIAYPPNRFLSAKVRVFIDWTITLFARHPSLRRG